MRTFRLCVACVVMLSLAVAAAAQQKDETVYRPGDGVSQPRPVKEVKPYYTAKALTERVQGVVQLQCVVSTSGTVRDVEVIKSLHDELDVQAVEALKQWEFEPGRKDGKPVAVRIDVELTFTLK